MNATNSTTGSGSLSNMDILYWIIRTAICIITILGNALVIFLIIKCRRLRTLPNTFIVALAIADMMVGVIITPTEVVCRYWCSCGLIKQRLTYDILYHLSAMNLCALTLDRYIATVRSLQYELIMIRARVVNILVIAWGLAVAFPVTAYILFRSGLPYGGLQIVDLILLQLLPPILLVIAYIRMTYIIAQLKKRQLRQITQLSFNYGENETRHTRTKASVKITGAIIIVFVVCYALALVRLLYFLVNKRDIPYLAVARLSRILLNMNSAINVFVYALMKGDFKQELRKVFKRVDVLSTSDSTYACAEQVEMR